MRAIIAPSTFHHFFVASAQQAFPAARTYAIEGLDRKRKDLHFDELLGDEPPGALGGPDGPGGHRQPGHARGGVPSPREPYPRRHGSRGELPRRDPRHQRDPPRVDAPLRHVGTAALLLPSFDGSRAIGRPPVSPSNGCSPGTSIAPSSPTVSCSITNPRRPSAKHGGGCSIDDQVATLAPRGASIRHPQLKLGRGSENPNFALLKLGGEAPVPSLGMPKSPVSSVPFPFSSWKQGTA